MYLNRNYAKNCLWIGCSKPRFCRSVIWGLKGQKQPIVVSKFDNDKVGLKCFKVWLDEHNVTFDANSLLVIENTGIYHRLIWNFCSTHLLPVYIGNAADLKWSFGIARGKNDK